MVVQKREPEQTPLTFRTFWASPRRALYALSWFLLFCIATAQLGLVSQQLQRGGNDYANYGNMMFKHVLGLQLFSILLVYLMCIGHIWASIGMMAFWVFVAAIFWGTCAGVIFQSSPYRHFNCGDSDPSSTFSGTRWGEERFFSQCSRIVAIQGLAWSGWGLLLFMFAGIIMHLIRFTVRPNQSFYGPRV